MGLSPSTKLEELPPHLKSLEAELAELAPRGDRLDRDELLFLAGQVSAGGRADAHGVPATPSPRAAARGIWSWLPLPLSFPRSPAVAAALSAVVATAATVLAMLALRPEPAVPVRHEVRIVTVPVERPADQTPAEGRALATRVESRPPRWESAGLRPGTPDLQVFDRLLRAGVDPWRRPAAGGGGRREPAAALIPYRQWLNTLLDDQASAEPSADWPDDLAGEGARL